MKLVKQFSNEGLTLITWLLFFILLALGHSLDTFWGGLVVGSMILSGIDYLDRLVTFRASKRRSLTTT
jgi:hypothetical protein